MAFELHSSCGYAGKPETIEDHVLYHATIIRRCTRQRGLPAGSSPSGCVVGGSKI